MTPRGLGLKALNRDQNAAAMAEFLIAFLPLLVFFLSLIELSRLAIAELMLQRSAGIAVRACAVIKDQPLHCDANASRDLSGQSPGEDGEIKNAAVEALRPLDDHTLRVDNASCNTVHDAAGGRVERNGGLVDTFVAQSGTDDVTVQGRFRCIVPLARDVVCSTLEQNGSPFGAGERTRALSARAQYGHQGARFDCWYSRSLVVFTPGGGWEPPIGFEF